MHTFPWEPLIETTFPTFTSLVLLCLRFWLRIRNMSYISLPHFLSEFRVPAGTAFSLHCRCIQERPMSDSQGIASSVLLFWQAHFHQIDLLCPVLPGVLWVCVSSSVVIGAVSLLVWYTFGMCSKMKDKKHKSFKGKKVGWVDSFLVLLHLPCPRSLAQCPVLNFTFQISVMWTAYWDT